MTKLPSVLLIDDDSTANFLNELLLKRLQVTDLVLVAESGQQGLALLAELDPSAPSLILLDVNMPGLTGIQFLEAYQRLPFAQPSHLPVIIMLTTSMDARDLGRLEELGINGLISKPLTPEKVNELLQLHFQRSLPAVS